MSVCPKKGIERSWCHYRDPFCGCEGCLVGTDVRTLYICLECGAAYYEVCDFEKKLSCPECGSIVECYVLDEDEDIRMALKEHYENCVYALKRTWKHSSKLPLGVYLDENGKGYVKLSFGRLDGWDGIPDQEFDISPSEFERALAEYLKCLWELEEEDDV